MFKSLEIGRRIKSEEFDERALALREQLMRAQLDLARRDYPLIIVVAGLDGSGKGELVHRINEWMDPRGISTNTYWEHSDEEESHPYFWRFWRKLPPRGETAIFLGSWYGRPALSLLAKEIDELEFQRQAQDVLAFERALVDDGALIVKLWLHVSKKTQQAQLQEEAPEKQQIRRIPERPYDMSGNYKRSLEVAEELILATDSANCPWHLVEAEDRRYRDITCGEIILHALNTRREQAELPRLQESTALHGNGNQPTVLSQVDLSRQLEHESYKEKLAKQQSRLQELVWRAYDKRRSLVAVFEGWDAAGKGSAIRRVTRAMDPRLFHLVQFAAPTDEEQARHYLWRFWRQLERDGRTTIFDRSWYGRVLVERVEGFASEQEWRRAYSEINEFEAELVHHGSIVAKFWLHISQDEQLRRFRERENSPHKQHKITDEDWRNREKWDLYEQAVDDMVTRTSTTRAPWTVVPADDKRYARIHILKSICSQLQDALGD